MASPDALKYLVAALVAEQERRRAARQRVADDGRASLLAKLGEMHNRLTQTPVYVAPTPEEEEQEIAEFRARFRAGYATSRPNDPA
jgi:hypothetical protein